MPIPMDPLIQLIRIDREKWFRSRIFVSLRGFVWVGMGAVAAWQRGGTLRWQRGGTLRWQRGGTFRMGAVAAWGNVACLEWERWQRGGTLRPKCCGSSLQMLKVSR